MVNHDEIAVAARLSASATVRPSAVARTDIAKVRSDIQARMERALTTERIKPLAKVPGNLANHGPKRWRNPKRA